MSKSFEEWWSTYKWNYLEECKEHTERSWDAGQKAMFDDVIENIEPEIKLLMSYFYDNFSVNLHRNDITPLWNKWQELLKRYGVK